MQLSSLILNAEPYLSHVMTNFCLLILLMWIQLFKMILKMKVPVFAGDAAPVLEVT